MKQALQGKIAVLIDGGFARKMLRKFLGRRPESADVRKMVDGLLALPIFEDAELLRVFWYDSPPLLTTERDPFGTTIDYAKNEQAVHGQRLLQGLEACEPYAVRRGEVRLDGWRLSEAAIGELVQAPRALTREDVIPVIRQKGVDIRIGLDIAWISSKRLVAGLVVVTSDSDFVPALKFARREGVSVVLASLGRRPGTALRAHADYCIQDMP